MYAYDRQLNVIARSILANRRLRGTSVVDDATAMQFAELMRRYRRGDTNVRPEIARLMDKLRDRGFKLITEPGGHERMAVKLGYVGLDTDYGIIVTPATIRSMLDEVNNDILALSRDVNAESRRPGTKLTSTDLKSYVEFLNEWKTYYAGSPSAYFGSTGDRAKQFKQRAAKWREHLLSITSSQPNPSPMSFSSPAPHFPAKTDWFSELPAQTKVAMGVGAALVISLVVVKPLLERR